jgi:hypothetical protein
MPISLTRPAKSIQGGRLKNQITRLTDEHSRTVPHNPLKAKAVMARLKIAQKKFRLHEGIADAEETEAKYREELKKLQRTTKTLRRKGQPDVIIRKTNVEFTRDETRAKQVKLLISGKKQFARTLKNRLEAHP